MSVSGSPKKTITRPARRGRIGGTSDAAACRRAASGVPYGSSRRHEALFGGGGTQPYLYELAADYPRRGGKMMRPEPVHRDRARVRRRSSDAVRSAVAIELLHNALLIHDDIEDESESGAAARAPRAARRPARPQRRRRACCCSACVRCSTTAERLGPRLALDVLARPSGWRARRPRGRRWSSDGGATTSWTSATRTISTMVLKKTCWLADHLSRARRRDDRDPRRGPISIRSSASAFSSARRSRSRTTF